MPLSDLGCRASKPGPSPKKMSDGGGLYLLVAVNGSRLWRMNYRFQGKQKTLAFGAYPHITLAEARSMRDRAKKSLAAGQDPSALKVSVDAAHDSFEIIAREWFVGQEVSWVPDHASRIMSRFEQDVFPAIGKRSISEIEAPDLLIILRSIEARGALDVSKRVRQTIGSVFRYAIATGRAKRDPAADLKGPLKASPRVKHQPSLRQSELPDFIRRLRTYDGSEVTKLSIELVMHTFVRTSELRLGTWDEIDVDLWRIPESRMKMGRDHLVPLTPQSRQILNRLKVLSGDEPWIVLGERGKPISQNTMIYALYRMGHHTRATIHGMRGTASTVLNESGLWSPDAIERQLAHVPRDAVRSAYNSALYLPERRRMMVWWSDFLSNIVRP